MTGPPFAITVGPAQTMLVNITVYVPTNASPNQIDNISLSATLQSDRSVIAEGGTAIIVPDVDEIHEYIPPKMLYMPFLVALSSNYVPVEEPFIKTKIWDGELYWQSDTSIKKEGLSSVRLETDVFSDAEIYSSLIAVLPNEKYQVSYWVKTDLTILDANVYGRVITAQYSNEAQEDNEIGENRIDSGFSLGENTGGESDWVYKSYTFTTNASAYFVRLRAPMGLDGHAKGQVWFDGVAIEPVN